VDIRPQVVTISPVGVDSSNGYFYFRLNNQVVGGHRIDYYYRLHLTTSAWTMQNHWAEWVFAYTDSTEDDAVAYDLSVNSQTLAQLNAAGADTFQFMLGVDRIHFHYSPCYAIPSGD
jgi:hypothetical protein